MEEIFVIMFKTKHFAVLISRFPVSNRTPWQTNYLAEEYIRAQNSNIALKCGGHLIVMLHIIIVIWEKIS